MMGHIGKSRKWLILGGGISGLASAQLLNRKKQEWCLVEQCPALGGLTRTINIDKFCFDYTGHFLHLARSSSPSELPLADLRDEEWSQISRRSKCLVQGNLITAPIQYNLGELPEVILQECVRSYKMRPSLSGNPSPSFRDFLVAGFGQHLTDLFLAPINEKTLSFSVDRLSPAIAHRFFPPPDVARIQAGIQGAQLPPSGYNSAFWYPKKGGIGKLVSALARGLEKTHLNKKVISVDLSRKLATTSTGDGFSWDVLLTSIPLKSFCEMAGEPPLVEAAANLSHSSAISFNLGMRGALPEEVEDTHWIYVPDPSFPFYRVGFYSNIGEGTCPAGFSSMYVECSFQPTKIPRGPALVELQKDVLKGLERLGWIDPDAIECCSIHPIRCAYVHHTEEQEKTVLQILQYLEDHSVHPIGRYGMWDYISMEDSIYSALSTVEKALSYAGGE